MGLVGTPSGGTGPRGPADDRLSELVVTLARLVLAGDDSGRLVRESVLAVARALDADRCELLRHAPDHERLLRVASCGEDVRRGACDSAPCSVSSIAGYALLCGAPVFSGNLEEEYRFGAARAHQWDVAVSAVAAPFAWGEGRGVLAAYAARANAFGADEALSLGRVVSLLGDALRRLRERQELHRRVEGAGRRDGPVDEKTDVPTGDKGPELTGRQTEVLRLMADGRPAKRIASELGLSIHTVHFHQRGLYRALSVGSSTEALKRAAETGLIRPPGARLEDR